MDTDEEKTRKNSSPPWGSRLLSVSICVHLWRFFFLASRVGGEILRTGCPAEAAADQGEDGLGGQHVGAVAEGVVVDAALAVELRPDHRHVHRAIPGVRTVGH